MKNIPRIFAGNDLQTGKIVPIAPDVARYLTRVMRRTDCLAFGGGAEYFAHITDDGRALEIGDQTDHADPSNDLTLMFAPIKRTDDLINMATQMGIAKFLPVITEHTVAQHINWDRMRKIATEAAEQSNRNSVPEILPPVRFDELNLTGVAFADERAAYGAVAQTRTNTKSILVGPEGGFSTAEFAALDTAGAHGISLGKTILRAELAAVIAIDRMRQ